MKFRYLVVDDEPLARKLIISHASKIEVLEFGGEFSDALSANNYLINHPADLVFLDIQMPQIDGFQFIRILKNPPAIILTTAFRDFAPEAYELDVVDYLLKPIPFERLLKSVNKFLERKTGSPARVVDSAEESFVYVRVERKMHKLSLHEILFIESLDEYIKIHMKGSVLVSRENISTMEEKLRNKNFVRIHRSFIVAIRHVKSISNDGVEIGGKLLPFGRTFKLGAMAILGVAVK